ncbi:uncharacterized protein A1O9_01197 [Exophiala aquamarina CBS 119918]|uniref:Fucose-specific lectin n=1 Tax=Exophiala aquamarina CBS 119918 TaxID=1182545 RepID=A0A072Q5L7_9EURO|nr:uncharacterized protein A1O9_01197 [Exophiala aquamarina CBS 119918]KEF63220.1 hypothetical protein A1O9_01197 [Exophiala aquamarina CBS 119918]
MGLEVDGRGIEAVESQPTPEAEASPTVWKKYRTSLLIVTLICAIGGVVGGAVGGTVRKIHHESTANSPDGNTSSPTTSSGILDQAVYRKSLREGGWTPSISEYEYIDELSTTANIAAVSRTEGRIDLFVRAVDYTIYHIQFMESDWQWRQTNGSTPGAIEAISWAGDRVDAFLVGFDGIVYNQIWRNSSTEASTMEGWSTQEWLGANDGMTHDCKEDSLKIASWGRNRYDFVGVRKVDNALYHRVSTGAMQWGT